MNLNDKYEIKTYCLATDQIGINVRHYLVNSISGGGLTDQELANALSTIFGLSFSPWLPTGTGFAGVTVQNLSTVPLPSPTASNNGGIAGSCTGVPLPRQTSGLIHLRTETPGRHGRGRVYVPFPCTTWNAADGTVTPAGRAVMDALRIHWGQGIVVNAGIRVTALGPAVRNRVTGVFTPIVSSSVDARWATQRRRGSFGRKNESPFS